MSAVGDGIVFVVAAPSGTGKTTLCRRVVSEDPNVELAVSHTTREPRAGEREGVHYHFVTRQRFTDLVDAHAFLEWAAYNRNFYGTSWVSIEAPVAAGRDVLLEIEVQGAAQVSERLASARLIFLLPPSLEELERRLRDRGTDSDEEVRSRLMIARGEIGEVDAFHYAVVNDRVERAVAELREVVEAEHTGNRGSVEARLSPRHLAPEFRQMLGLPVPPQTKPGVC